MRTKKIESVERVLSACLITLGGGTTYYTFIFCLLGNSLFWSLKVSMCKTTTLLPQNSEIFKSVYTLIHLNLALPFSLSTWALLFGNRHTKTQSKLSSSSGFLQISII